MKLYDSFVERDLEAIPEAVHSYLGDHTSEELWQAVTRFAVLAYAPSQHAKHALFSCLAAWDLREEFGQQFDAIVTQCAIYAASSRQPWSEPPMLDPPPVPPDPDLARAPGELRKAIEAGDRAGGERWLAARFQDPAFAGEYFAVAAEDPEDLGHKLIAAVTAYRLGDLLGEKGRFAALRVGIWEMAAYRGVPVSPRKGPVEPEMLASRLVERMVAERGDMIAAHRLFFLDAALLTGDAGVIESVCATLESEEASELSLSGAEGGRLQTGLQPAANAEMETDAVDPDAPVYSLARDYGELLKSCAAARRLAKRFPSIDAMRIVEAALDHLSNAPSSDGLTFA